MITEEPKAWIKKYFSAASDEYWLFFKEIIGINDIKLSSSPIQIPNQEEEEIDKVVPRRSVNMNKRCDEEKEIKKRGFKPHKWGMSPRAYLAYLFDKAKLIIRSGVKGT